METRASPPWEQTMALVIDNLWDGHGCWATEELGLNLGEGSVLDVNRTGAVCSKFL